MELLAGSWEPAESQKARDPGAPLPATAPKSQSKATLLQTDTARQQRSAERARRQLRAPPTGRAREGPSAWPAPRSWAQGARGDESLLSHRLSGCRSERQPFGGTPRAPVGRRVPALPCLPLPSSTPHPGSVPLHPASGADGASAPAAEAWERCEGLLAGQAVSPVGARHGREKGSLGDKAGLWSHTRTCFVSSASQGGTWGSPPPNRCLLAACLAQPPGLVPRSRLLPPPA